MTRPLCAALLAAALGGCAVPGQSTFAPEPDPKPAPPPAPLAVVAVAPAAPADARVPLLTIRYDVPEPDYATVLPVAVHAAQTRRPGVQFDVVSVVPTPAEAPQGQLDAAQVSRAIEKLGTSAARVHLNLRIDPAATPREVLVYPR